MSAVTNTWLRPFPVVKQTEPLSFHYNDQVVDIEWLKKSSYIDYNKRHVKIALGDKDSGKGMLLSSSADKHLSIGHTVLLLQGAHDQEHAMICRDPLIQALNKKILFLTGDDTEVSRARETDVKFTFDQCPISRLRLSSIPQYDVIINVPRFYRSTEEYYSLMRPFVKRMLEDGEFLDKPLVLTIGEASEILQQNVQTYAEAQQVRALLTAVFKQSRHIGVTIDAATQRWEDVQKAARLMGDYYFIKALGMVELSGIKFERLWSFFNSDWLESMKVNECTLMTDRGSIGYGTVLPATGLGRMKDRLSWHKEDTESVARVLGIEPIERKEKLEPIVERELSPDVDKDVLHRKVIEAYMTPNFDGTWKSIDRLEAELGIADSTIQRELKRKHDFRVEAYGECDFCARSGCSYSKERVTRTRSEAMSKK